MAIVLAARGPPLLLKTYEISKFPKDFKISGKISRDFRFHERFHGRKGGVKSMRKSFYNVRMRRPRAIILDFMGFTGDFKISRRFRKISGFHVRFQDFTKDFKIRDFKISRKISRFQERFHSKCTRFQQVANPSTS